MILRHRSWIPPVNRISHNERGETAGHHLRIQDPQHDLYDDRKECQQDADGGQKGDEINRCVRERQDCPAGPS